MKEKLKQNLSPANCKTIGIETAKMHEITKDFKMKRQNDLSVNSWRNLFNSIKDKSSNIHKDLPKLIEENLKDVEKKWPKVICLKELFMLIYSMITFFSNKENLTE